MSYYITRIIHEVLGHKGVTQERLLEGELRAIINEQLGDLEVLKTYIERDRKEMALFFIETRTKQLKNRLEVK